MVIMLIISSLLVRAGRANAFVSSAVPFLQQMKIAWMLKSICRGLSKRALIQAVQESKELGHNMQATQLLELRSSLPGTHGPGASQCMERKHQGRRVRELTQLVDVFIRTLVRLDR